jgi:hypothetical protein
VARNLKFIAAGRDRTMARDERRDQHDHPISPLGHELTMHLERAHELAERAQRANGLAQREMSRACAIVDALSDEIANAPNLRPKR